MGSPTLPMAAVATKMVMVVLFFFFLFLKSFEG